MTPQEMDTEIASLRKTVSMLQRKDEARQKNWRALRFAAGFVGVLYILGSLGLLITGIVMSRPVPLVAAMQYTLLFAAIPTILLANVLIEPRVGSTS